VCRFFLVFAVIFYYSYVRVCHVCRIFGNFLCYKLFVRRLFTSCYTFVNHVLFEKLVTRVCVSIYQTKIVGQCSSSAVTSARFKSHCRNYPMRMSSVDDTSLNNESPLYSTESGGKGESSSMRRRISQRANKPKANKTGGKQARRSISQEGKSQG